MMKRYVKSCLVAATVITSFTAATIIYRDPAVLRTTEQAARVKNYRNFFEHLPLSAKGKVIDEDGQPVPSATIEYGTFLGNGHSKNKQGITDSDGCFSISEENGISLVVSAAKQGYYSLAERSAAKVYPNHSAARSFDPNPQTLTTSDEVILVLRKRLPPSGAIRWTRAVRSDMSSARKVWYHFPTGGFRAAVPDEADVIEFSVDAPNSFSFKQIGKFQWALEVRAPGGGVVTRTDQALFLAPEEGYTNPLRKVNEKDSPSFSCVEHKELFVRFSDGRYGMIHFSFDLRELDLLVFEASLGQPGSRNLTP